MAISVNNLHKTYKGRKTEQVNALRGVSFALPDTGMVFILGKSGCGKSTLLNVLGGLDGFDEGDIVVDGKSMKGFSAKEYDSYRNNYVGFVFQENNLLEQYTVKRNIGLALELQSQKGIDEKIAEALERVDLEDFGERRCNRLSGGQKQRVAIARALIKQPEMLLCDEPTGSLDSTTGKEIFELLKKISENTLVVVVSHDRESAEKYGDRIIEISDGSVLSDSAPLSAENGNLTQTKKLKSSGLPAKRALGLGAGYLIARPVRLALCVLICLITFTCIGIADTINSYDRGMAIFNTVEQMGINEYVFGREMIEKGRVDEYSSHYIRNMSKEDYGRLETRVKTKRLDKVYSFYRYNQNGTEISQLVGSKDEYLFKIRGFTETDEQFFGDYGYTLYGRAPKNYDEAVISLHTFKGFVKCSYGEPDKKLGSIFGNTSVSYINVEGINEYDDIIGKQIKVALHTFTIVGIADTKMDNELYGDFLYKNKELTDDEESDFNHYFNEYIHNVLYLAQGFRDDVVLEDNIKVANEHGGNYTADTVEDIKRVIAPYNGSRAEKLYNLCVFKRHFSYEGSENLWCFDTENLAVWNISSVDSTLNIFAEIFLYVTIAASVISVLYVIYFTSGTISEKSKEIGVLRALGASRRDIIKLFCAENGIFAAGIIAVTTTLSAVGAYVLNNALAAEYKITATLITFGIRQFAVLAAVAIGAIAVGIAIPIIKLLRAKPVDIIAGRK